MKHARIIGATIVVLIAGGCSANHEVDDLQVAEAVASEMQEYAIALTDVRSI